MPNLFPLSYRLVCEIPVSDGLSWQPASQSRRLAIYTQFAAAWAVCVWCCVCFMSCLTYIFFLSQVSLWDCSFGAVYCCSQPLAVINLDAVGSSIIRVSAVILSLSLFNTSFIKFTLINGAMVLFTCYFVSTLKARWRHSFISFERTFHFVLRISIVILFEFVCRIYDLCFNADGSQLIVAAGGKALVFNMFD